MRKIELKICLTDIPEDRIKGTHDGKKYVDLVVVPRKEVGKFGDTHSVSLYRTRNDMRHNKPTVYVGSGTERVWGKDLNPHLFKSE